MPTTYLRIYPLDGHLTQTHNNPSEYGGTEATKPLTKLVATLAVTTLGTAFRLFQTERRPSTEPPSESRTTKEGRRGAGYATPTLRSCSLNYKATPQFPRRAGSGRPAMVYLLVWSILQREGMADS